MLIYKPVRPAWLSMLMGTGIGIAVLVGPPLAVSFLPAAYEWLSLPAIIGTGLFPIWLNRD